MKWVASFLVFSLIQPAFAMFNSIPEPFVWGKGSSGEGTNPCKIVEYERDLGFQTKQGPTGTEIIKLLGTPERSKISWWDGSESILQVIFLPTNENMNIIRWEPKDGFSEIDCATWFDEINIQGKITLKTEDDKINIEATKVLRIAPVPNLLGKVWVTDLPIVGLGLPPHDEMNKTGIEVSIKLIAGKTSGSFSFQVNDDPGLAQSCSRTIEVGQW